MMSDKVIYTVGRVESNYNKITRFAKANALFSMM